MEYTDARCETCGAWRTALVGYGGARVCLGCGGALDRPAGSSSLARLSAASGLDPLWGQGEPLARGLREERLRAWLGGRSVALPDAYVEVLARCDRASEVRFALPIVTLSTWRPVGEGSFSDGSWTLRVRPVVRGRTVDFLLEGPGASRPLVVEIEEPEGEASLAPRAAGYPVLRVPADRAEESGTSLRSAFQREALEVLEREPEGPHAPGREGGSTRRMWSRHELVYDAAGLPTEERRELVEDWLRSRGERLEGWQLDFLARCERAGEVHFALPFLRLPHAEPADARTVHLDPWHTLTVQVVLDDDPVDFAFLTSLAPGRVATTLVEVLPARGPRDPAAERRRLREWSDRGHTVVLLAAAEAGARGRRWADSLRGVTPERSARGAG